VYLKLLLGETAFLKAFVSKQPFWQAKGKGLRICGGVIICLVKTRLSANGLGKISQDLFFDKV